MANPYRQIGPDFHSCGVFCGTYGQSAAQWFQQFEKEMAYYAVKNGSISPDKYLQMVDVLLGEDAAYWVDTNPGVMALLSDSNPTQATVDRVKMLFMERFPDLMKEAWMPEDSPPNEAPNQAQLHQDQVSTLVLQPSSQALLPISAE